MKEPKEYDLRVDYDDHPNEVSEKFTKALAKHGIKVEDVSVDLELPFLYYKIVIETPDTGQLAKYPLDPCSGAAQRIKEEKERDGQG